jgi:hypothetical protein
MGIYGSISFSISVSSIRNTFTRLVLKAFCADRNSPLSFLMSHLCHVEARIVIASFGSMCVFSILPPFVYKTTSSGVLCNISME